MTKRDCISDVYVEGIIVTNGIIVKYRTKNTKNEFDELDVTNSIPPEIINYLIDGAKKKEFNKVDNDWCEKFMVLPTGKQCILTGLENAFLEKIKLN